MKKVLEGKVGDSVPARISDSEFAELCAYIQAVDHQKIREFFKKLESKWRNSCNNPTANIREFQLESIILMTDTRHFLCNKIPSLSGVMESSRNILDAIIRLQQLSDIINAMTEAVLQMSDCLPLLSADNNIKRIVGYVNTNYSEDIKLKTLGQLFNYNSAYLGKRFKQYTGKSLHAYLDIIRIEKAKEMLTSTGMKVYEISYAVGYANTDYFYSKFKKYAGHSPLAYKENQARQ